MENACFKGGIMETVPPNARKYLFQSTAIIYLPIMSGGMEYANQIEPS